MGNAEDEMLHPKNTYQVLSQRGVQVINVFDFLRSLLSWNVRSL